MQVADDHAVYYRDLPADVRAWGVERLMQMIRAGEFPKYRQIARKRFWAGRDVKAYLAAHPAPPPLEPAEPDAAQDGERPS